MIGEFQSLPRQSEDELEFAFLGIKTADQVVKEALDTFQEDLQAIFKEPLKRRPAVRHRAAA